MFANEVNWKEAAAEFWYGLRNLTPHKVWAWLTFGPVPMRLVYAIVIPIYLIYVIWYGS